MRMKNGSILHGVIVRFENGIFTVIIPGTQSRAMVHVNDVEQIEFASDTATTGQSVPVKTPMNQRAEQTTDVAETSQNTSPPIQNELKPLNPSSPNRNADSIQLSSAQDSGTKQETAHDTALPKDGGAVQGSQQPIKSPQTTENPPPLVQPNSGATTDITTKATDSNMPVNSNPASSPPRTPAMRELTVRVSGKEVWSDSGLEVKRGDTIRFSASGRINLSRSQSTGPEGVNVADPQKMMPHRPTGGLIGVIGDDNDEFIFIGVGTEIQARRDGRLFMMVNENVLEDNTGAFTVRIQTQSSNQTN
jgi:hypothetical protein